MKLLFSIFFISVSFLYAQKSGASTVDAYSQELNDNAINATQKNIQNKEIISNVNTVLLQGNVQRSNIKVALNYYFDIAQPCQAAGNQNLKETALPALVEINLISEELLVN